MATPDQPFDPEAPFDPDVGIFGQDIAEAEAALVLLGVPWDATASYFRRAASGPRAIQRASAQLDLWNADFPPPYERGVHFRMVGKMSDANRECTQAVDAVREGRQGALSEVDRLSAERTTRVASHVATLLEAGKRVGVIGGDHSCALAPILAHAHHYPDMGILHIDAHADLRDAYEGFAESHASVMFNVLKQTECPLVSVGLRDCAQSEVELARAQSPRMHAYFDDDLKRSALSGTSFARTAKRIVKQLPKNVYVSWDIDGLDPTLCPGTGTPVPGGLSFAEASELLRAVVLSGRRIVGFDLCEVAEHPSFPDWDGNVGARLLYRLCGWTLFPS